MDYGKAQVNSENYAVKLIGTSSTCVKKLIENINPVQTFVNGNGCRVGVLAYCTDLTGNVGAQNLVDALIADGRFGSVTLIDGDVALPTAQFLLDNFDSVIAVTDNRCGDNTPVADSAANALAGFAQGGGGVVLSTFGFSTCIGFGDAIFTSGLSPFQRVECMNAFNGGQIDLESVGPNPICQCIFNGVTGPITVVNNYSNSVTLSPGADLCATYINDLGFAAVNSTGNIIGLNTFPFDSTQLQQEAYRRLVANALLCVCGGHEPTRGVDFIKLI